MKIIIRITAACAFAVAVPATATAQVPSGGVPGLNPNGPGYSPYLNLLRSGNSAGFNYYGLVRPELQFRNAFRGMEQQIGANQANIAQLSDARGLPFTGHTAVFLNTGGYFLNMSGGGKTSNFATTQMQLGTGAMPGAGMTTNRGTGAGTRPY